MPNGEDAAQRVLSVETRTGRFSITCTWGGSSRPEPVQSDAAWSVLAVTGIRLGWFTAVTGLLYLVLRRRRRRYRAPS